jgi:hypothetical protein
VAEQVEEREVDRVIRARAGVGLPPDLFELAIQVEVVLDLVTTVLGARMTVFRVYQVFEIDAPYAC